MHPPSILWPFPWWTAALTSVLLSFVPWLWGLARARRWNQELSRLGPRLQQMGIRPGPAAFSIGEGKNVLVVDGDGLAVADLRNWKIIQKLSLEEVNLLKIYEDRSDRIEFRVVINGGAQTRKITTRSIAGFGRLFALLTSAGKPIEYIQR
jgi:hypothetical protein